MKIYKYPLVVTDEQTIMLPEGAKVLTLEEQYGEPMLWALVDPDAKKEGRLVRIYGTGHEVDRSDLRYVSTFQMHGGALVFHVFMDGDDE